MAAPILLALFHCFSISSFFCNLPFVSGARELAASRHHFVHGKWPKPFQISAFKAPPAKGVEVDHSRGPRWSSRHYKHSPHDHSRTLYQNGFRFSPMTPLASNLAASFGEYGEGLRLPLAGGSIGDGNFVVKVGFGSEPQYLHLNVDTGSGKTWIQCEPCSTSGQCYTQQDKIFDPVSSTTFKNASCNSTKCEYSGNYLDGSYSQGYMAQDTLKFSDSVSFPGFFFGCGLKNSEGFGQAAGILALGQSSPDSLLRQTSTKFSNIFCYCLPRDDSSSGYLLFGMEALETCQTGKYTPIASNTEYPDLYFVNLKEIRFGQKSIDTSASKTFIDSGTHLTHLPPSVYDAVLSEFQQSMVNFTPVSSTGKECYDLGGSSQNGNIPFMVLRFDNIELKFDHSAVVWTGEDSTVCLAFVRNGDDTKLTIIGNYQHRSINVLYNVAEQKLGFGELGNCR